MAPSRFTSLFSKVKAVCMDMGEGCKRGLHTRHGACLQTVIVSEPLLSCAPLLTPHPLSAMGPTHKPTVRDVRGLNTATTPQDVPYIAHTEQRHGHPGATEESPSNLGHGGWARGTDLQSQNTQDPQQPHGCKQATALTSAGVPRLADGEHDDGGEDGDRIQRPPPREHIPPVGAHETGCASE